MESSYIRFPFTGRYFKLGENTENTERLWFVLHGQGQLAQYFIQKFSSLEPGKNLVVAPEGLSRYYTEGVYGKVGASWMTREDRLTDIDNYLRYLNEVYREVTGSLVSRDISITLLGFSQGAATVSRWCVQDGIDFDRLILWSGIFPPDMDFDKGSQILKQKPVYLVYDPEDKWLTESRLKEAQDLSGRLGIEPEEVTFSGGHKIEEETLLRFV